MKPAVEEIPKKDEPRRHEISIYRLSVFAIGLGVAWFAFLLYLWTLAPTVLYYERPDLLDAAMLQAHAYALGITQPTGYPTYTMLAHLFTYLPLVTPPTEPTSSRRSSAQRRSSYSSWPVYG